MVQNDKPIVKFLNIMVLLSSILVLVIISIELLSATTILSERFILNTHLMVCTIFLADFFVRWYFSQEGWHFLGHHIFLLLISEYRIYFFRSSFPCHLGFTAFNSYRPGYLRYINHRQLDDPQ